MGAAARGEPVGQTEQVRGRRAVGAGLAPPLAVVRQHDAAGHDRALMHIDARATRKEHLHRRASSCSSSSSAASRWRAWIPRAEKLSYALPATGAATTGASG